MTPKQVTIESKLRELIDAVSNQGAPADVQSRLAAVGIDPSEKLADSFTKIVARLGGCAEANDSLALLLLELLQSPYPAGALVNLLRFLDTAVGSDTFLNTVAGGKPVREILATVFGTSQYMSDIIVRSPGSLYWLIERQTWERAETRDTYLAAACADVDNFHTVETSLNALRRFQRRMLLKIGVQDLLAVHTIEETTRSLSDLADAITECTLRILRPDILGTVPDDTSGFAVLALGKLGGAELNYSSDIDVVYLCRDGDEEQINTYTRLAKRLTAALSDITGEGYLYRVDLRLRPDGRVGPIVSPMASMMVYYENRGRPWEFQAMLKARVTAGDDKLGRNFIERVTALTFSPSLSYSPKETIAVMRSRIRENISSRDRAYNVKLMEGGIRDIEFIVQTLQLIHGGSHPELRSGNTLEGLDRLYQGKHVKKIERDTLAAAYLFFRLVEHRLQMMHQLKTHSIPQSLDEINILARRVSKGPLGTFGHEDFLSTLTTHLNKVRVLSDSFFGEEDLSGTAVLLLLPEDDAVAQSTLARYSLADVKQSLSIIQSLAYGSFPDLLDRGARNAFQKLLPHLLEALSHTPDPSNALVQFSRIIHNTTNRASLYNQLAESKPLCALIRDIAGSSPLLSAKLSKQPDLLSTLAQSPERLIEEPFGAFHWNGLGGPVEEQRVAAGRIRRVIDRRELAAWVTDVDRRTLPATLAQTVTDTTREIVTGIFESVVPDASDRVVLLALGSFGVGEPRPGSDVDLLVISKDRDLEPVTRAVQTLTRMLTDPGLLKLDFRLRGEGASAPLVQDIGTYARYFRERMSPWERVAFAKCARWCGDAALADEFFAILRRQLTPAPDDALIAALREIRTKLEGLVPAGAEPLETKRSAGGRYDIEYLCALGLAQVHSASATAGVQHALDASTTQRLDRVAEAGLLKANELKRLKKAAGLYALVECLLELRGEPLPASLERTQDLLGNLDRTLTLLDLRPGKNSLAKILQSTKTGVRRCYESFLSRLGSN